MTKEEVLTFIKEREAAYGNMLCWLRNANKDKEQINRNKDAFTIMHAMLTEDQTLMHPYDFDHFQYYCKLWYKLPYITKKD